MADAVAQLAELSRHLQAGDVDALRTALADDYYGCAAAPGDPSAAERIAELAAAVKAAAPDLSASLDDPTPNDDGTVGATLTVRGTHEHDLWGRPGTGEAFEWSAPVTFRPSPDAASDRFAIRFDGVEGPDRVAALRRLHLVNPPDEMDQPNHFPVVLPEFLVRLVYTGEAGDRACSHLDLIQVTEPTADACQECAPGEIYPALRMCLVCGFVGCCDAAKGRHMAKHYDATGHPIFRSIHGDDGWIWCYADDAFFGRATLARYAPRA
jgi:hypothetical protein